MNIATNAMQRVETGLDLEQFYDAVFSSEFAVYLIRVDQAGTATFEDANHTVAAIAGRPREELVGCRPRECLPAEIGECLETQVEKCVATGSPLTYERTLDTPNGQLAFRTSLTPIGSRFDRIEHIFGITRDITLEANLVEDARQNAALLKRLGIALPNAVFLLNIREQTIRFIGGDPDGVRSEWRGKAESAGSAAVARFFHPDDHQKADAHLRELAELPDGEVAEVEFRILTADGEYRPHLNRETVFSRTPSGEVELVLGVSEDISELERAEMEVRDLSERLLTSQIDERRRIAEDLHDSTGQHLFAVGLALTRARSSQAAGRNSDVLFEALDDARHSLQVAQREVRMLSYLLHPPEIISEGLAEALGNFARGFGRRSGHYVEVRVSPDADKLGDEISLNLFRACQEALTNVYRHADASMAVVTLEIDDDGACLEVTDDGVGFDPSLSLGVGLSGMRERFRRLGGDVDMVSGPDGTTLRVTVPTSPSGDRELRARRQRRAN